jgi:hypothetical protein
MDALSLKCMRRWVAQRVLPHIPELSPAFEPNERHKNTLKTAKQQGENQMKRQLCSMSSVPRSERLKS